MYNIPEGFLFASINAEIKYKNRDDLALIYCPDGVKAGAVFTKNKVKAAPVLYSQKILSQKNKIIKALLVNSGNANACTGKNGLNDCYVIAKKFQKIFNIEDEVLLASTGVIGVRLPVEKILNKIKLLKERLSENNLENIAKAIMTTDTFPKIFSKYSQKENFTICGIAKGAGMINPNMATMLAFIFTDANLSDYALNNILKEVNEKTFNSICVDGDTSTNDSVFLLTSGKRDKVSEKEFKESLYEVMLNLSKMIVKDGEGATKLIKIIVKNGISKEQCKKICENLSKSLLVKTAFFGGDPNWGRIICTVGYSDDNIELDKINLYFGEHLVVKDGIEAETFSEEIVANYLEENKEIEVIVDLNIGNAYWEYYTCDLTYEYVKINAEYRT